MPCGLNRARWFTPLSLYSTFVANKRLTRKEWSDGRINLLEASPQFSHHFLCRMSSWIVTQKAKLSKRDGFSAIQCSGKRASEWKAFWFGTSVTYSKLCLGVKWNVFVYNLISLSKIHSCGRLSYLLNYVYWCLFWKACLCIKNMCYYCSSTHNTSSSFAP